MLRQSNGLLSAATWDQAFARAADLLAHNGGVAASADLSNEAFWVLESMAQQVPGALWPPAGAAWPLEGSIVQLGQSKSMVLVGLDAWHDLPQMGGGSDQGVSNQLVNLAYTQVTADSLEVALQWMQSLGVDAILVHDKTP